MSDSINPYAPPQVDVLPPADPSQNHRLASLGRRFVASMIDTFLLLAILMPVMWFTGFMTRSLENAQAGDSAGLEEVLWAVVSFLLFVVLNWVPLFEGQTIGKRVMKMRIVRKDGQPATRSHIILKRSLPVQLIALLPTAGNFLVLLDTVMIFRSQRNTFHDDFADTKVIDVRPSAA
jgi:uncharacterized RDD family membrane protein YckC